MDIFQAAEAGDLARVRALVEQDQSVVHARDIDYTRWPPLLWAANGGDTEVVLYLLDHGAAINYRSNGGATALLLASCDERRAQVVRVLLQRGADVTVASKAGNTALLRAALMGGDAIVRMLLKHGGSDVDARGMHHDWTALHFAAYRGNGGWVRQLLEAGADPTLLSVDGYTAVDTAEHYGRQECVRILHDWDRAYLLRRARLLRDASAPQPSAQQSS